MSSRNSSPRVPVIAIRRRCRSSKSSTTVSAAASCQRCWPKTRVARIMRLNLLHLAVADDLDHRRRRLHLRGIFPPHLHVGRAAMRVEVVAGLPALYHHILIGIVHADMAVIGDAALLLERFGGTGLVSPDEVILVFRLHLRGGDDVDHDFTLSISGFRP